MTWVIFCTAKNAAQLQHQTKDTPSVHPRKSQCKQVMSWLKHIISCPQTNRHLCFLLYSPTSCMSQLNSRIFASHITCLNYQEIGLDMSQIQKLTKKSKQVSLYLHKEHPNTQVMTIHVLIQVLDIHLTLRKSNEMQDQNSKGSQEQ